MPNGTLTFLSACKTAMGNQNLLDEAMSLDASLIFSGSWWVITTMWYIVISIVPLETNSEDVNWARKMMDENLLLWRHSMKTFLWQS